MKRFLSRCKSDYKTLCNYFVRTTCQIEHAEGEFVYYKIHHLKSLSAARQTSAKSLFFGNFSTLSSALIKRLLRRWKKGWLRSVEAFQIPPPPKYLIKHENLKELKRGKAERIFLESVALSGCVSLRISTNEAQSDECRVVYFTR